MEMCRVCLTTETEMKPLDETFVFQYNLLTNLNVNLLDGMPQFSCGTCSNTVKCFVEFRDKCIASEATLREIICSQSVKSEDKQGLIEIDIEGIGNETINDIKCEIKEEKAEESDSILENFDYSFEEYEEDVKNIVKFEGVKTKIRKKCVRKTKQKENTLKIPKPIEKIVENGKWFCGICPESFDEKLDLNKHLDIHKNDKKCAICEEHLSCLSQLFAHRLAHVPSNQTKCHICDKRYKSCMYLEHHYRTVHIKTDSPKLPCKMCPSAFNTPKRLNCHMREIHSGLRYFCDVCSKGFRNKSSLRSHIKQHSSVKSFVCDLCGFSCRYSGGLKDHKIRRHSQKKIYCKNCTRPFATQLDHDRHTCKEKLKICSVCGLQLRNSSRLSKHMAQHTDVPRYECNRCPAKYKSKGALIVHTNRHDGNRTHQCEYCPAKFYSATVLIKHRRTHTGEKPYVCKVCNKGFTGNHNLKVHMKVHGEYLVVKRNADPDSNNVTK